MDQLGILDALLLNREQVQKYSVVTYLLTLIKEILCQSMRHKNVTLLQNHKGLSLETLHRQMRHHKHNTLESTRETAIKKRKKKVALANQMCVYSITMPAMKLLMHVRG